MDGLDIFNVYVMGSIEMLTVFHFFTRFLKKKVKFIYYILFAFLGMTIMMFFTTGSIMELLVYVLLLMAEGEALQFSVILSKCRIKDFRK